MPEHPDITVYLEHPRWRANDARPVKADRIGLAAFDSANGLLLREGHARKRALTDPRLFSSIDDASSDDRVLSRLEKHAWPPTVAEFEEICGR